MATARNVSHEDHFLCSICLGVFNEPVSTPCGHNYCKSCISDYWDRNRSAECPLCKEKFSRRPKLRVNTEFRDMVDCFTRLMGNDEAGVPAKPGEVACDLCTAPKLKALKTCLVCLASYCQTHLVPHQSLKKHKVVEPVSNLDDKVCKTHDKLLEFFCYEDQQIVCLMCLNDDHAGHRAVPVEQAAEKQKTMICWMNSFMEAMEKTRIERVNEMKGSLQQMNTTADGYVAQIDEVFTTLKASLLDHQGKVTEMIKQTQKEGNRNTKDGISQLEREAAELKQRRFELQQVLAKQDQHYLLRNCPSFVLPQYLGCLRPTNGCDPISAFTQQTSGVSPPVYIEMMKKSVEDIEQKLSQIMDVFVHGEKLQVREVWTPPEDRLMMIQQCDAVNVTLDPYTAKDTLVVSEDGKQLTFRKSNFFLPYVLGRKFQYFPFVLGKEGFSSGRFYYEVQVSGCEMWLVGVVKESMDRGSLFHPQPHDGAWVFQGFSDIVQIFSPPIFVTNSVPYVTERLQTVGVFADYEKGEVSFYDVVSRNLLYSFTGCSFTETPTRLQALVSTVTGSSSSRAKLYPILGMYRENSDDTLIISPGGETT